MEARELLTNQLHHPRAEGEFRWRLEQQQPSITVEMQRRSIWRPRHFLHTLLHTGRGTLQPFVL